MNDSYPNSPAVGRTDTSAAAAMAVAPITGRVQRLVWGAINQAGFVGMTTNELAETLQMDRSTVQPRTSELRRLGRIKDSGQRRFNSNRKRAIVWVAQEVSHG